MRELKRARERRRIADFSTVTDSLALARAKYPGQKNNLDALCKRLGIDNTARTLHGALLDAEILAEVYPRRAVRQAWYWMRLKPSRFMQSRAQSPCNTTVPKG